MSEYLARLKQLECEKNSHHAHDTEPSKPSKAPFESFEGTHPGVYREKINDAALLTAKYETIIRAWMAHMEETDAQIIGDYLDDCRHDPEALAYFLKRAKEDLPKPVTDDDRRHCTQCLNLTGSGLCLAARQINISPPYRPNNRLPVRCAGYVPNADDPDQRPGSERWPCLI